GTGESLRLRPARLLGAPRAAWRRGGKGIRSLGGGLLVQERDLGEVRAEELKVVTRRRPAEEEVRAALFAWKVVKHVKSNAIVFGAPDRVLAIGAGQTSRVDAVKLAASKAHLPLASSALASDAFFPFRDCLYADSDAE